MSTTEPKSTNDQSKTEKNSSQPRRPNEQGSFTLDAHIRIFDPQTREIYVEGRA
jgi:hypothetical protein